MPENRNNAAYRVYTKLSEAANVDGSLSTLAAWTYTLKVNTMGTLDERYDTIHLMHLLENEVALAETQTQSADVLSDDLYDFAFVKAKHAIDVANLGIQWWTYKQHLTDDALMMLKACSQVIPAQEEWLPSAELEDLAVELKSFRENIMSNSLRADVKAFVWRQIGIMERTILEAEIIGSRAFTRGMAEFAAELQNNRDLVENNRDEPDIRTLAGYWRRFVDVVSQVNTLGDMIEKGKSMLELGGDVVDKL